MFYRKHVFFCVNQKKQGAKCCAMAGSEDLFNYARQRTIDLDLKKPGGVRVSRSGCLGRCGQGPSVVIYPEGVWYRCANIDEVERVLQEVVLGDGVIEELLMPQD